MAEEPKTDETKLALGSDQKSAQRPAPKASGADAVDEITYIPEEGDPIRVKWNGVEFKAHVPVKISRKQMILTPVRTETMQPDGTIVTRHIEKRIPMVELAAGNLKFSVNGAAPAQKKEGSARVPTNSDEYRGYAIRWISASNDGKTMDARWDAEDALREKCGCNDTDIAYLRPFFEARHEQVSGAIAA